MRAISSAEAGEVTIEKHDGAGTTVNFGDSVLPSGYTGSTRGGSGGVCPLSPPPDDAFESIRQSHVFLYY